MVKKFGILAATLIGLLFISSCDKDGNELADEKIQTERIEDIIPKQYLDTLTKLNFKVHKGINPPTLNGKFAVKPHELSKSNIPDDPEEYTFSDAVVSLYGQNDKDFSINLLGENFISNRDTSISTAISGSGNNFTIYGKVKGNKGSTYGIVALLISGSLDGENLKDVQTGIIMVDDSKSGGFTIKNGQARVAIDSDLISERIGDVELDARIRSSTLDSKSKSVTFGQLLPRVN